MITKWKEKMLNSKKMIQQYYYMRCLPIALFIFVRSTFGGILYNLTGFRGKSHHHIKNEMKKQTTTMNTWKHLRITLYNNGNNSISWNVQKHLERDLTLSFVLFIFFCMKYHRRTVDSSHIHKVCIKKWNKLLISRIMALPHYAPACQCSLNMSALTRTRERGYR